MSIATLFDQPIHLQPRCAFLPRDYQQEAIDRSFRLWSEGHIGVLARSPTGSGKTVIGAMIADLWLQQGDEYRVLILAHERQLIQQFAEEIYDVLGFHPGIEMGDQHCTGKEKIIVGSRQTLYIKGDGEDAVSRLYKFRPELKWLLILDEGHRWKRSLPSCKPIIEWFEQNADHRRLLLTATPERSDKVSLKGLATGIALDYRLFDIDGGRCAVNDGWAVPYDQRFIVVDGVDFKNIREVAKDFDKAELERILNDTETLAKLCDPLLDIVGRKRTIIFSPGKAMARDVALYINSRLEYEAAVSLDGSFPDEDRKRIYKRHQAGSFQFLSVCGLCREGYNDPGIQCVAVFRPTKSRGLAEQMKGRGCRPLRGIVSSEMTVEERVTAIRVSDKPTCMIVDLVGVTGLGDCPSTASIMAEGKPDEVIQRANKQMLAKNPNETCDVAAEIRKAETDLSEEKRIKREQQRAAQQAEMDRWAKLKTDTRYSETKVGHDGGGKRVANKTSQPLASQKQVNWLKWKGITGDLSQLTKGQARRMFNQIKSGSSAAEVMRTNRIKSGVRHGGDYVMPHGEYAGHRLRDIPLPNLKTIADTFKSPDIQKGIAEYRVEWWNANRKGK